MNRYFAFAEEATYGTAVAAEEYVDPENVGIVPAGDQALVWQGASGIDRVVKPGGYNVAGSASLAADDEATPFFWRMLLGSCSETGTADATYTDALAAGTAAGDTSVQVADTTNAAPGMHVQVGSGDTAEVATIDTVDDGTNLTFEKPLKFAHDAAETVASVTDPFTHIFSVERGLVLPSFTGRVGKDLDEEVFSGCVVNGLTFSLDGEFLMMELDIVGAKDAKNDALIEDPTWTDGNHFANHEVTADVAGADASARIESFSLSVQNNAEMRRTIGSRFPRDVAPQSFLASLDVTFSFVDHSERERFWGQATGPIDSGDLTEFAIDLHVGADYDLALPRGVYPTLGKPIEGRSRITQTASYRGLYHTATSQVLQVTVVNDRPRY